MNAGMAALLALVGFVGMLILACLADLVSEEVRARLDRLPHALIAMAVRRAPAETRAELAEEWTAELHEILRDAQALPITRLVIGTRYAAGLLRTARGIGHHLSPTATHRRAPRRLAAAALEAFSGVPVRTGSGMVCAHLVDGVVSGALSARSRRPY